MKEAIRLALKTALERARAALNDREYYLKNAVTARQTAERSLASAVEVEAARRQEVAELVVTVTDLEDALNTKEKKPHGSDSR